MRVYEYIPVRLWVPTANYPCRFTTRLRVVDTGPLRCRCEKYGVLRTHIYTRVCVRKTTLNGRWQKACHIQSRCWLVYPQLFPLTFRIGTWVCQFFFTLDGFHYCYGHSTWIPFIYSRRAPQCTTALVTWQVMFCTLHIQGSLRVRGELIDTVLNSPWSGQWEFWAVGPRTRQGRSLHDWLYILEATTCDTRCPLCRIYDVDTLQCFIPQTKLKVQRCEARFCLFNKLIFIPV